jgi:hypothetical protein
MTTGVGDDSPGDFLKYDFTEHVRAEHPEHLEEAQELEPVYVKPKR